MSTPTTCAQCQYFDTYYCDDCSVYSKPKAKQADKEEVVLLSASEAREKTENQKRKGREVQFQNDMTLIKNTINSAIAHEDYICFINIDALSDVKRCMKYLSDPKVGYYVCITDNDDLVIDWSEDEDSN